NPASGAAIWFHLGKEPKGEVKLEVLDSKGNVIAKAKSSPGGKPGESTPEADDDDDDDDGGGGGKKERKLEAKAGLNRFVWDLTHDGADTIPGAVVDSGSASRGVPVAPGKYTVKLTVGPQSLTQEIEVKPDPRVVPGKDLMTYQVLPSAGLSGPGQMVEVTDAQGNSKTYFATFGIPMPSTPGTYQMVPAGPAQAIKPTDLAEQEQLALRVRDDISKLSDTVARIRALKRQIDLRQELLKDNPDAKDLLKQTKALEKKLDELEGKLHNPKAKIAYDIFAARGGAMLYSQFAWLLSNLTDSDGPPTKAQLELADELEKQLNAHLAAFDKLAKEDIAKLNAAARKLNVPELYVPPPKKNEAPKPAEKK